MSVVGNYSRALQFEEMDTPLEIQEGVLAPVTQKARAYTRIKGITGAATEVTTAGAATYTAAQLLTGIIVRDCAGASRTDTLPTATLLVAALPGVRVGDVVAFKLINGSDPTTEVITVAAGSGGSFATAQAAASRIVLGGTSKEVLIRITGVASPAYVVYL